MLFKNHMEVDFTPYTAESHLAGVTSSECPVCVIVLGERQFATGVQPPRDGVKPCQRLYSIVV